MNISRRDLSRGSSPCPLPTYKLAKDALDGSAWAVIGTREHSTVFEMGSGCAQHTVLTTHRVRIVTASCPKQFDPPGADWTHCRAHPSFKRGPGHFPPDQSWQRQGPGSCHASISRCSGQVAAAQPHGSHARSAHIEHPLTTPALHDLACPSCCEKQLRHMLSLL